MSGCEEDIEVLFRVRERRVEEGSYVSFGIPVITLLSIIIPSFPNDYGPRHLASTFSCLTIVYSLVPPIDQSSRGVTTTHSLENGNLAVNLKSPCSCTPSLLPMTQRPV